MSTQSVEQSVDADLDVAPNRWWALAVVALAQLMVVLDGTVVNIALPDAQRALGMSDTDRQWVVTAYALAFGGLLLLGGRIADYWGRKRTFMVGMVGFALASAIGGIAQNSGELFAARALQGVFGALLAPASLSLLQVTFAEGKERAKAFGVYGAIAGGGAAVGLVLGGLLTEYASWRWCLLVNVPVAAVSIVGAVLVLRESKAEGDARYDVPGAASVSLGLAALVFGFTKASEDGWGSVVTIASLIAAVVLLVVFVLIERSSSHPLLPLHIPLHPTRGGAYLTSLLAGAALLGGLLFLTYYFQITLQYSPLKSGVASLPLTAAVLVMAGVVTPLVTRIGPKPLMVVGPIVAAAGMAYLTQISATTSYVSHVLPSMILIGAGLAMLFVPLSNLALVGVGNHDAGAASALVNATQQVGGALGTALFSTIYSSAVASFLARNGADAVAQGNALVHGYTHAFGWAAAAMLLAAVLAAIFIRAKKEDLPTDALVHVG
ncbi:MAG: transporter [Frankiales bacterium]|nr:transporter [Frankiales bacterium]